ncbi:MAG TPA: signal peptidase I [Candidatus Saccharimonadales bacterium]|nr:signal peptidase I [Candidatus Saccharimonadales bacterium]
MSKFKGLVEIGKIVLAVIICAVIIRNFLFQPFVVDGSSMEPNYHNNEYLLVEKLSYHFYQPKRDDVIVFKYPNDTRVNYIKRVIGLPGDTIKIENGFVYVNGAQLSEPYLQTGVKTDILGSPDVPYQVTVGSNEYFVMGDNREHSSDSRTGWMVPKNLIIGKSELVLYNGPTSTATATN